MKINISLQILVLLFTSCRGERSITVEEGTIIQNITIITANNEKVDSFLGYVVINGDEIVYADKKTPSLSGNFKEIDGKGKFIVSGLMDSHVHLANTAGFNGQLKNKYPELVEAYFEQLPRSYLYHGFTTLIDVNNYAPQLISQIKNSALHPDIYTCGNQVQVMDDFMMEMEEYTPEIRYQFPFLHDKYNEAIVFPDSINLGKHTTNEIITGIKAQDGVGVKLAYEDEASGLNVSWAKPSKDILSDLVSEAKKQNLPVLLHAPSLEGHQVGLESGVAVFAHGLWNWTANFKEEFNNLELTPEHKEVLLQIAQNKIGYQLTFRAITGEQDLVAQNFGSDKNLEHIYPKAYLDILKSEEGDWGRNKIIGRGDFLKRTNPPFYVAMRGNHASDEQMWPALYHLYKSRLNTVAKFLSEYNANFILGSDSPAMNMFTNPPGYNGFLEMIHMYEAGIPLETIFRAATYNNLKTFHLENLYGGVEKDKIANLLILKSNPLKTINAYNDIETVIIGGKVIPREKLSATNIK